MPTIELNFEQGLAYALGELIRQYDEPSIAIDILNQSGFTYEKLKESNVVGCDLKVIRKALLANGYSYDKKKKCLVKKED